MHLNYNLGIHPNGHSSPQNVSHLCEGVGSILGIPKFIPLFSATFITFWFSHFLPLYYILFLFPSNLLTIVQLFSNI